MNLKPLFCDHTGGKLNRRRLPASAPRNAKQALGKAGMDLVAGVLGFNTTEIINYRYHCGQCNADLPPEGNLAWQKLYERQATSTKAPPPKPPTNPKPNVTTKNGSATPKRTPIPSKMRLQVLERDRKTCRFCGRRAPDVQLHVDHVIAVSKGGTNDLKNLQTLCQDCNLGKGNRKINL